MALKPPDMSSCSPKSRCTGGANAGLAYNPSDPCPAGTTFNSSSCDCDPEEDMMLVYYIGASATPYQMAVFLGTSCDFIGPATGYGCKPIYAVITFQFQSNNCSWSVIQSDTEFCNKEGGQPYPSQPCPDLGVTTAFIPQGSFRPCPDLPDESEAPECVSCQYDVDGNPI